MYKSKYIAIEGLIGSPKNIIAKELALKFNSKYLTDKKTVNPFLENFKFDAKLWSLQTQIFFLISRYSLLKEISQPDLFFKGCVSDFSIYKDKIYAHQFLEHKDLEIYNELFEKILEMLPKPDLIIFIQMSDERIDKYHKNITDEQRGFLKIINRAYNDFFYYFNQTPNLIINIDDLDIDSIDSIVDYIHNLLVKEYIVDKRIMKFQM